MAIIKKVALGLSGGVDSAVSAYLLKQKGLFSWLNSGSFIPSLLNFLGFEVTAFFMRNWDERDETGYCSSDKDYEDAQYVSEKLQLPIKQVSYVKEYWTEVFRWVSCFDLNPIWIIN